MTLFKKPTSVKGTLLVLLLPASIALMGIAWFIHGVLLERMSQEFIENRLKEEVVFLEQHLRQNDAQIDLLTTANHFENVFHRSEEHTSELQSRPHLVCRLLLEKKKNIKRHKPKS